MARFSSVHLAYIHLNPTPEDPQFLSIEMNLKVWDDATIVMVVTHMAVSKGERTKSRVQSTRHRG